MSVEGEKVLEPQAPPPLPKNNPVEWDKDRRTHQALVDNFNTQKALYNSLASEASDVRTRETETRQVFADACSAVIGNPVWKEPGVLSSRICRRAVVSRRVRRRSG